VTAKFPFRRAQFILAQYCRTVQPVDGSHGSWNNGLKVVEFVNCLSLERLRVYIQVHDPYGSQNSGLRVVQLVNCIHNCIPTITETNMVRTMYVPRSKLVHVSKRKTLRIFFVPNVLRYVRLRYPGFDIPATFQHRYWHFWWLLKDSEGRALHHSSPLFTALHHSSGTSLKVPDTQWGSSIFG